MGQISLHGEIFLAKKFSSENYKEIFFIFPPFRRQFIIIVYICFPCVILFVAGFVGLLVTLMKGAPGVVVGSVFGLLVVLSLILLILFAIGKLFREIIRGINTRDYHKMKYAVIWYTIIAIIDATFFLFVMKDFIEVCSELNRLMSQYESHYYSQQAPDLSLAYFIYMVIVFFSLLFLLESLYCILIFHSLTKKFKTESRTNTVCMYQMPSASSDV